MLRNILFALLALGLLAHQLIALRASLIGNSYSNTDIASLVAAFPFLWLSRQLATSVAAQFTLHYLICLGLMAALFYVVHRSFPRTWLNRVTYSLVALLLIGSACLLSYYTSLLSVEPRVVAGLKNKIDPWPPRIKLPARDATAMAPAQKTDKVAFPAPYPHFVTFRPADGSTPAVNPPRMSWPYVAGVIPDDDVVATRSFVLQISALSDFSKLELEVETGLNFYNALAPLQAGTWHWRVGYPSPTADIEWSASRQFTISETTPTWDRSLLKQARGQIASRPHPRLGPPDGDWQRWTREFENDPVKAELLSQLIASGLRISEKPWWRSFPATDRWLWTRHDEAAWAALSLDLAQACFVYRLTDDSRLERVKDHVLALSRFRIGGRSSPETHGGKTKLATQVTEALALCYDWLYHSLDDAERQAVLEAIEWRLNATYQLGYAYQVPGGVYINGVALWPGSHPFENFMWSLPAVLLTAGDSALADELSDLVLNYLVGITFAFGPDEGFNEGYVYAFDKADSVLNASLYTRLLLPQLALEKNPVYRRFGDWLNAFPVGIERMSFAEYMAYPEKRYASLRNALHKLALTTGRHSFLQAAQKLPLEDNTYKQADLKKPLPRYPYPRPWIDLLTAHLRPTAASSPVGTNTSILRAFPDAGWIMASNQDAITGDQSDQQIGMLFMARPRGGYSHSYRAENSFNWYAYGHTLSSGGGTTLYPDPYARSTMSHNAILIDGRGQQWNPRWPARPYVGQILKYTENEDFAYWVGDATNAYQNIPALAGWQRHVVFVDKKWFIVFDDIYLETDAEPAKFSWLFKVHQPVPVALTGTYPIRLEYQVGDTRARVLMPLDETQVTISNLTGTDGLRNPITGEDFYPDFLRVLARFEGSGLPDARSLVHNNIWITTREPQREWSFLSVLTATPSSEDEPVVRFDSRRRVTITSNDGRSFSIAFEPDEKADFVLDVDAVRLQAGQ